MSEVETRFFTFGEEAGDRLELQPGGRFGPVTLAYETYGELNADRSNAVLLFHALTGSQHAAGFNPSVPGVESLWNHECRQGWWDDFIGPGRALDTDRFFVICANYFGGCYGSTGPSSLNPETGKPYGSAFPKFGANDIVNTQVRLLNHLGIERLYAAAGASLGGLLTQNLAVRFPELCERFVLLGCALEISTLTRAHNFEQILAIENDPNFNEGDYYGGPSPERGLALARIIGHKTYVSLSTIEERARDECIQRDEELSWYQVRRPLESYLLHQGRKLLSRFDANTYLHLMAAWSDYDLLRDAERESYGDLFAPCRHQRYMIFSIDSDVCFYPEEQEKMHHTLVKHRVASEHLTVHSDRGHDSFLLEPDLYTHHIRRFLESG
ncbi:homoserine O-acetyltransferase MetX [Kiritimatiella glycovorans]|uniref:Homoserine O-acetyltransferase n=1 Tax=Kiritimatiella glycovorans TaxID=1307763 RepID=A0A0G3ECK1_9BACT|nr:homoserine O-acetyltransferase [Kiritimatiella glycovorans]AKJ64236.1 Homoserine O-acetyltransferase [Kiritimatiella glycovorans]